MLKEAWFYEKVDNSTVKCNLCRFGCVIKKNKRGRCRVRENVDGKLFSLIYKELTSFSIDYIEKAPLYHFYPSHRFLNVGSIGCNLSCAFCLAWPITQADYDDIKKENFEADSIVRAAKAAKCKGIVYTHSEPTLNIEFYYEIMKQAKKKALKNVFATNGLITAHAFSFIADYIDAVALTLKGSRKFYRKFCGVDFNPEYLFEISEEILRNKKHVEIVYVLIPKLNDSEEEIKKACELANFADAPLIFLRFFPSYKMDNLPSPKEEELERALEIAYKNKVKHAYIENIFSHPGKNTYCNKCGRLLIRREGFGVVEYNIKNKACSFCGEKLKIVGKPAIISAKI